MGEKLSMTTQAPPASVGSPVHLAHGAASQPIAPPQAPEQPIPNIGTTNDVRGELLDALADAKSFYQLEPDEIIRMCMGHSARLSEVRVVILEVEAYRREWRPVLKQVESVLDHLREQFSMASRLITVRELDWKMETGVKGAGT